MNKPRRIRYLTSEKKKFFPNWSITNWLILINVIIFAVAFPLIIIYPDAIKYVALQPSSFFSGKYVWAIITSVFMHGGILHLAVNMFVLFSLGTLCEKIIGRKRYLWFYLLSGIIASLFFVLFAYFFGNSPLGAEIFGSPDSFAVGASGAIFAVAGLFVILTPKLKFTIIFFPFFSLPAYIMIPVVLLVTWAISLGAGIGVGNTAHLGGLLCGIIYGVYLRNKYKRKSKLISEYYSK